jgi:acyl-coenzyme A thioesterase PaaI-like protein
MSRVHTNASLVGQQLHHDNCLGCGALNNYSFHIPSTFDEQKGEVEFTFQLRREHEGAPGYAHGGGLALILDEAQGVLCHHLGHFVMTDGFSIKYHKATPLYRDLRITAWLTSARSKRLYTKARIQLGDEILVESKIKWYIIPERLLERRFGNGGMENRLKAFLEPNRVRAKEIRRRLRAAKVTSAV